MIARMLILLSLAAAEAAPLEAQASACMSQVDSVRTYLTMLRDYYGRTDSATTVTGGDPWAAPSKIALVTNSTTCRTGVNAFNSAAHSTGAPNAETRAYIYTLGTTGWLYVRPGDLTSGRRTFYIFARNWSYRGSIVQ